MEFLPQLRRNFFSTFHIYVLSESSHAQYRYAPLATDSEIRLLTILPGVFETPISVDIKHAQLVPPDEEGRSLHPPLKEIRETLPAGWSAFETLEGRILFGGSDGPRWTHPDPSYDEYDFSHFEGPRTSALKYEALSYTWGDPKLSEEISVAEERRTHPQQSGSRIATKFEKSTEMAIAEFTGETRPQQLTVRQSLAEVLRHLRYPNETRTMWIDAVCINQNDMNERNKQVKLSIDCLYSSTIIVLALNETIQIVSNDSQFRYAWLWAMTTSIQSSAN